MTYGVEISYLLLAKYNLSVDLPIIGNKVSSYIAYSFFPIIALSPSCYIDTYDGWS